MAVLGAVVALGTAGVASASTAGRQSVPPPVTNPLPPGGFCTIVTNQTITTEGGVIGPVDVNGAEVTIFIPAGAFVEDVQITITAADLSAIHPARGFMVVAGVGVEVTLNGAPYPGPFLKPITIEIASPKINASSEVDVWNGSGFVIDANSTSSAGRVSISMDSDPAFIVQSPIAPIAPVPSATAPMTGEPFLGEGILAGLLVLGGTGAIFTSRRRRVKALSTGTAPELPGREELWDVSPRMPRPARDMTTATRGRESNHKTGGKSVYRSRTRSRVAGTVIMALTTATLAGCSTGGSASGQPAAVKPRQIFAAPRNLLAAGQPQPNGTFWALAGDAASKGLFDINLTDGKRIGSVSVSNAARSVTESLSGGVIGLALGGSNAGALELLDGGTGKVIRTIPLGAPARDVIAGADGATFYVLNGTAKSSSVTIVNSKTGGVQGTIPMPLNTVSIAPDSLGVSVYALQPDGQVSQIAVAGGQIMTKFVTGPGARSIALSPDGSTLYVLRNAGEDANVALVNTATESVQQVLPGAAHSVQLLVSADGSELYQLVGTSSYGNIQVFNS
jgi:DNA-binding beta-propeller fold protein YncE